MKKGTKIILGVIIVLLIVVIGVLAYMYVKTEKETKTQKAIIGTYNFYYELTDYEYPGEENKVLYSLTLFKDGTYCYDYGFIANMGEYGNYTIDGDTLILNKWFEHGSDVSVTAATGETRLKINKDGSITDTNSHFDRIFWDNSYKKPESVTMQRASKEIEDNMSDMNIPQAVKYCLEIMYGSNNQ